jgi:hypothetical protein
MPSINEYPDVAREKKLNLDVAQIVGAKIVKTASMLDI